MNNKNNKIRDAALAISLIGIVGLTIGVAVLANRGTPPADSVTTKSSKTFTNILLKKIFDKKNTVINTAFDTFLSADKKELKDNKKASKALRTAIVIEVKANINKLLENNKVKNAEEYNEVIKAVEEELSHEKIDALIGKAATKKDGDTAATAATGIFETIVVEKTRIHTLITDWLTNLSKETKSELLSTTPNVEEAAEEIIESADSNIKNFFKTVLNWDYNFIANQGTEYKIVEQKDAMEGQLKTDGTSAVSEDKKLNVRRKSVELLKFIKGNNITDDELKLINSELESWGEKAEKINLFFEVKNNVKKDGSGITKKEDKTLKADNGWNKTLKASIEETYKLNKFQIIEPITSKVEDTDTFDISTSNSVDADSVTGIFDAEIPVFEYSLETLEKVNGFINNLKVDTVAQEAADVSHEKAIKLIAAKLGAYSVNNFDGFTQNKYMEFNLEKNKRILAYLVSSISSYSVKDADNADQEFQIEIKANIVITKDQIKKVLKKIIEIEKAKFATKRKDEIVKRNKKIVDELEKINSDMIRKIFKDKIIESLKKIDFIKSLKSVEDLPESSEDGDIQKLIDELKKFIK